MNISSQNNDENKFKSYISFIQKKSIEQMQVLLDKQDHGLIPGVTSEHM